MIEYIETQTKNGETIRIEVAQTPQTSAGFGRASVSTIESTDFYNQTLKTIQSCANGVIDTIQNLEAPPTSASIDFAIKIDAKAGAMIAKSPNEAQFKISLSWKKVEPKEDDED